MSKLNQLLALTPPPRPPNGYRDAMVRAVKIIDDAISTSGPEVCKGQLKLIIARAYLDRQIRRPFRRVRDAEVRWAWEQLHANGGGVGGEGTLCVLAA